MEAIAATLCYAASWPDGDRTAGDIFVLSTVNTMATLAQGYASQSSVCLSARCSCSSSRAAVSLGMAFTVGVICGCKMQNKGATLLREPLLPETNEV